MDHDCKEDLAVVHLIDDVTVFEIRVATMDVVKAVTDFNFRGKNEILEINFKANAEFHSNVGRLQFDEIIGFSCACIACQVVVQSSACEGVYPEVIDAVAFKF